MANINYTTTGNASDAERAVQRLQARFERLEDRLRLSAAHSRRNSREAAGGFERSAAALRRYVAQYFTINSAIIGARRLFQKFIEDHERLLSLQNKIGDTLPAAEVRVQNQGRFTDEEFADVRRNTEQVAKDVPIAPVLQAFRAQEELTSQGFDTRDIKTGEALRAVRNLQLSTNQFGNDAVDVKQLIRSLATALRNQPDRDRDAPLTAKDIENFEPKFVALFESTPAQFQDLIPFARIESVLGTRGFDLETQLGSFIAALEGLGSGDVAATGLQQTSAFLQRSATQPIQKQLKKRGIEIDTSGFDLIGEDFPTALENLGQTLDKLVKSASNEETGLQQRAEALTILFGARNQAAVTTLIPLAGRIRELRDRVSDSLDNPALIQQRREAFNQSTFGRQQRTTIQRDIGAREGLRQSGDLSRDELQAIFDRTFQILKSADDTQASLFLSSIRLVNSHLEAFNFQNPAEALRDQIQSLERDAAGQNALSPTLAAFGGAGTADRVLNALQQSLRETRNIPVDQQVEFRLPESITTEVVREASRRVALEDLTPKFNRGEQTVQETAQFKLATRALETAAAGSRVVFNNPGNPFEERILKEIRELIGDDGNSVEAPESPVPTAAVDDSDRQILDELITSLEQIDAELEQNLKAIERKFSPPLKNTATQPASEVAPPVATPAPVTVIQKTTDIIRDTAETLSGSAPPATATDESAPQLPSVDVPRQEVPLPTQTPAAPVEESPDQSVGSAAVEQQTGTLVAALDSQTDLLSQIVDRLSPVPDRSREREDVIAQPRRAVT